MTLTIDLIPLGLYDNYAIIFYDDHKRGFVSDPGSAAPVLEYIKNNSIRLEYILNTHYHWDHTDGNDEISTETGAKIIAPFDPENRIKNVETPLKEGDNFTFHGHIFTAIHTPCHTTDHMCYYNEKAKILLAGDTLFSMGCGRFFEGTANDMFAAFEKIRALPDDTMIYCNHEYTHSNGQFALSLDPTNSALKRRMDEVIKLRDAGKPTLPISLKTEKETNPFLRAKAPDELADLRKKKDAF